MDDLTAFIAARLDEDEAAAGEVHLARDCNSIDRDGEFNPNPAWCTCAYPARVLREVAAKRATLADHQSLSEPWAAPGGPWCSTCGDAEQYSGHRYPCATVRHLATVWSDHPDYRSDWAP